MEYLTPVQFPEQFLPVWWKVSGIRGIRLNARAGFEIVAMGLDPETIAREDTVLRNVVPQTV
jgi:hypothetical protein